MTLFSLLFYLYSYGCNVMFCVSSVSSLLFSRAYRFFSRVAAESAVLGICRFLRRSCVFRCGRCFRVGWGNAHEIHSAVNIGSAACASIRARGRVMLTKYPCRAFRRPLSAACQVFPAVINRRLSWFWRSEKIPLRSCRAVWL